MLRKAGLLAIVIGGVGPVAVTLHTGRRNPSVILMALFAIWVLLPHVLTVYGTAAAIHGARELHRVERAHRR